MRRTAVLISLLCLAVIGIDAEDSTETRRLWRFSASLLSPDGRYLAYRVALDNGSANSQSVPYQILDLTSGASRTLPGTAYLTLPQDPIVQPAWSPDSRKLAYQTSDSGAWAVSIWSVVDNRRTEVKSPPVCGRMPKGQDAGCVLNQLQWSPDSEAVFFNANPAGARPADVGVVLTRETTQAWERLLGRNGANDGMTVLTSPQAPGKVSDSVLRRRSEVLRYDLRRGVLTTIAPAMAVSRALLSPDGSRMLVVGRGAEPSSYAQAVNEYSLVPVTVNAHAARPDGPREGAIVPGEVRLRNVRGAIAGWSPDGRSIAVIESGALTNGDIVIYSLERGDWRNITEKLKLPGETPQGDLKPVARNYAFPGQHFGSSPGLVWSRDGRTIYASRRARAGSEWRTELWAVSPDGGGARRLGADAPCDLSLDSLVEIDTHAVLAAANCGGLARIYRLTADGAATTLLEQKGASPRLLSTSRAGDMAFVMESVEQPEEIVLADGRSHALRRATNINGGAAGETAGRGVPFSWKSADGEDRSGRLFLPRAAAPGTPPPLILQLYPRDPDELVDQTTFAQLDASLMRPLPDLVRQGYAVLKPQLPVVGGGKSCDTLALEVSAAVEAVGKARLASSTRVGVIGISFGGWTVNCLVTRLPELSAAVSVAGISDWVTHVFSPVSPNVLGGGQVRIGADPWQAPELFWRESPLSGAREVKTPLLLIHGKRDDQVAFDQSVFMFRALSRLDKVVTLVGYDDVNHGSVVRHPDYEPRVKAWFTQYMSTQH